VKTSPIVYYARLIVMPGVVSAAMQLKVFGAIIALLFIPMMDHVLREIIGIQPGFQPPSYAMLVGVSASV